LRERAEVQIANVTEAVRGTPVKFQLDLSLIVRRTIWLPDKALVGTA
jgi:hypothetical protein